jgi:hypothetical protein
MTKSFTDDGQPAQLEALFDAVGPHAADEDDISDDMIQ